MDRRQYFPREERILSAQRGRLATRRNELIISGRRSGNAYRPVWEGWTTARPPFEFLDDDEPDTN